MNVLIDELISKLTEFKDFAVSLDDIESTHSTAKHELEKTNEVLAQVKADLTNAQSGLTLSQVGNLKKYEEDIFEKRKEFEDISNKVDHAKAELADLTAKVSSASSQHTAIEASIESLRKKHFA